MEGRRSGLGFVAGEGIEFELSRRSPSGAMGDQNNHKSRCGGSSHLDTVV